MVGYPSSCSEIPREVILNTLECVFLLVPVPGVCTRRLVRYSLLILMLTECARAPRSVLQKAGFVQSPEGGFDVAQFVNTDIASLI